MESLVDGYLRHIMDEVRDDRSGSVADYIPELAVVDPEGYGLSLCVHDGYTYSHGDSAETFTIQSVSKPLTYAMALRKHGVTAVDAKIGVEPSGEAFNEISVDDRRRPKNPMINAGAIFAASMLLPASRDVGRVDVEAAFAEILDFYSGCAGRQLTLDDEVYTSESVTGSRNRAIAYMLDSFGALETDPDAAIDLYYRQCSIRVTTEDLAGIGATIANGGLNPRTGRMVFSSEIAQRLLSVMTTCGMYDGAGDWVTSVGLPAKSGVGGGILAVLPGQLGIGVYSPRLDEHGNSVRGVETCWHLSKDLGLHMFNVTRESRVTIRSVYDLADTPVSTEWSERERSYLRTCRDKIRVYELQGDLTFAGAESVQRRLEADIDRYTVVIVEISRIGVIDAVARTMVLSIKRLLDDSGRRAALVDPDGVVRASVIRHRADGTAPDLDAPEDLKGFDPALPHVHATMEDAVIDAETFMLKHYYDQ
ncbi:MULTISPECIES: glutaminase A [Gordonia]|uniref:glutaminase A n=1 Tax=Gordonia TaxID=2053 RepID=UPI00041421C6|nr:MULTISPECIES: glutaminase A [Gordonia]ATD70449.1 glutaminase A [Gordonia sp. 1D]KAF0966921.1 Glutaminase [Gordonia sp. YY1]MCZ4581366.1 glutaminase A [Gordonia amicalis]MCZ4654129.1 glutaminase A [Gordonia amicalis]MDJ0455462.1 glutaminase A [Gordonia amicalis]